MKGNNESELIHSVHSVYKQLRLYRHMRHEPGSGWPAEGVDPFKL